MKSTTFLWQLSQNLESIPSFIVFQFSGHGVGMVNGFFIFFAGEENADKVKMVFKGSLFLFLRA